MFAWQGNVSTGFSEQKVVEMQRLLASLKLVHAHHVSRYQQAAPYQFLLKALGKPEATLVYVPTTDMTENDESERCTWKYCD